jgi:hypothetical protein
MKNWLIESSVATVAILALCLAMSDSPYFPYANFIGIGIMGIIAFSIREERRG